MPFFRAGGNTKLASYLEKGPLMCMMPLLLHVNQKSDYDMMISIALVPTVKYMKIC